MATGLDNLWVYKLAEELELEVHELTKKFPRDELYRSIDQIRRSSSAATNNIAESYHKTTPKEKIRFIDIAKGEAEETKRNQVASLQNEVFSLGLIVWENLSGKRINPDSRIFSPSEIITQEKLSDLVFQVLQKAVVEDPEKR